MCCKQNKLIMNKNILKAVIADNQTEVLKYKVIPREFAFEDFGMCLMPARQFRFVMILTTAPALLTGK